jgi:O-antigen ligase/cytochrome c-type biogenesis protein CcmH/NrfG
VRVAFDGSRLQRVLVFLCAVKVAGVVLIFDPAGLQAFDLPKSLFSHAMALALAGTLGASFARYGRGILPKTRLHFAVAGFVLANIAAAIFAENRYIALFGDQDRYLGLAFVADMVVLYLAVAVSLRSLRDFASLLGSVTVVAAVAVAYAAVQTLGLDPVPWSVDSRVQPFATFGHPDIFSHFLSISFGLSVGVAVAAPGTKRPRILRLVGLVGALACLAAASVVAERGALVGVGAALVVAAVAPIWQGRRRRLTLRELAALGALALALFAAILAFTPLGSRTSRLVDDAGSGRLAAYDVALRAALARPVLGYGPDSFGVASPAFRQPPPHGGGDPETSAHDWVLQAVVTTGVLGLIAVVALLVSFGYTLWRVALVRLPIVGAPILLAMAAYWVHGLVAVGSISVDWFPWVCFGGVAAVAGERQPAALHRSPRRAALALPLIVLGGLLMPLDALRANRDANTARAEWTASRTPNAVAAAQSAVSHDPGRAEYWNWLGLARSQAGQWGDAAGAFEEASRRAPHEATYWVNLALARGRQALSGGDPETSGRAAIDAARRAWEVDPFAPRVSDLLSDIGFQFGDFDLALLGSAQMTAYFDPTYGHRAFLAAQRAPDLAAARRVLERALAARETAGLRDALAAVSIRGGDLEAAQRNAVRAQELAPDDPDARALLEELRR